MRLERTLVRRCSFEPELRNMVIHIVIGTQKFMGKSGGRFVLWQSARGLAQSKTLRVFQGIIVSRAASWSVHPPQYCYGGRAVALHRFCHRFVKRCPC